MMSSLITIFFQFTVLLKWMFILEVLSMDDFTSIDSSYSSCDSYLLRKCLTLLLLYLLMQLYLFDETL